MRGVQAKCLTSASSKACAGLTSCKSEWNKKGYKFHRIIPTLNLVSSLTGPPKLRRALMPICIP